MSKTASPQHRVLELRLWLLLMFWMMMTTKGEETAKVENKMPYHRLNGSTLLDVP
jgi:hypothetical protein